MEAQEYPILDVPIRSRAVPILQVLARGRRERQLLEYLKRQEPPARALYSLLSLGLVSNRLSTDFVGVCYLADLRRLKHSTLKKSILDPAERREFLKKESCSLQEYAGNWDLDLGVTLEREYKPKELRRGEKKGRRDLAVLFEDGKALIPERWKRNLGLRLRPRHGYQFVHDRIGPSISALLPLARTCLGSQINAWALPNTKLVHDRLRRLIDNYRLDDKYREKLKDLASAAQTGSVHAAAFVGFALCDLTKATLSNSLLALDTCTTCSRHL